MILSSYLKLIIAFIIFVSFVFIQVLFKTKKPIKKSFFAIVLGVMSLIAVNISGIFTGVCIPISALSLFVAAVAGIPGTILLLLLNVAL